MIDATGCIVAPEKIGDDVRQHLGNGVRVHEREDFEQLRRLPASVEERLGSDQERNNRLLDEICTLPQNWQILVFATSVSHAQAMAAFAPASGAAVSPVSSGGGSSAGFRE